MEFYKGTIHISSGMECHSRNRVRSRGWLELDYDSGRASHWSEAAIVVMGVGRPDYSIIPHRETYIYSAQGRAQSHRQHSMCQVSRVGRRSNDK